MTIRFQKGLRQEDYQDSSVNENLPIEMHFPPRNWVVVGFMDMNDC
jgi:hypothetical protein